jgi:lysophospholipase L1-like esterase
MKLLIRGGSIAAGYGVRRGYVDILRQALAGKGIDVINISGFQQTSFDGIETFRGVLESVAPDILLIHFGVDDAFQYVFRSEFQENIVRMVQTARTHGVSRIFLASSQMFDDPEEMGAVGLFYRSLRIVAADLDCGLIPVHIFWDGYLDIHGLSGKDLLLADSRYPNERGHAVIAEAILKWLEHIRP